MTDTPLAASRSEAPTPTAGRPVPSAPVNVVPELFSHSALEETLRRITADVASAAGFRMAAVSVFRNSEELEFLVVSGDPDAEDELVGDITPTPVVLGWLEAADVWGSLRFLPHERTIQTPEHVWVGDDSVVEHPDAWQPYDMLFAPLTDTDGRLQGILWVDLPIDGLRPGPLERREIEVYAAQASQAILVALERSRLVEQVRLADASRRVRGAAAQLDLDRLLAEVVETSREGFGVDDVRVLLDSAEREEQLDELSALARRLAHRCWDEQRVAVVSAQRSAPGLLQDGEHGIVLEGLRVHRAASLLLAPLGAGTECLGRLLMFRRDREDWSDEEAEAALEIGHDVGRAVLNARSFQREQQAAAYKQQLIATMAHELKNPLAAVTGYASMLEDFLDELPRTNAGVDRSLRGIGRAATRLGDIVGDLLALSRVDDAADRSRMAPVDLRRLVVDAGDLLGVQAAVRDISVQVALPEAPVVLVAEESDLERLVTNLVSNAVKYSHDGGRVDVRLEDDDETVLLVVSDAGIGISAEDQEHLFEEFFRSSDPAASSQPGTGLGLAIAQRVVARHGGRIAVHSSPGRGSTFTVTLPRT